MPFYTITDNTAAWANSAPANTAVDRDIPEPESRADAFLIVVRNPSTESALTVKIKNKETFPTGAQYPQVDTLAVPANSTATKRVVGFLVGEGGRITLSNDTVLGAAGAFTADVRVRKA